MGIVAMTTRQTSKTVTPGNVTPTRSFSASGNCVLNHFKCDGVAECADNSDERNCTCKEDSFQCKSDGACIRQDFQCDDEADCEDESDEQNCEQVKKDRAEEAKDDEAAVDTVEKEADTQDASSDEAVPAVETDTASA